MINRWALCDLYFLVVLLLNVCLINLGFYDRYGPWMDTNLVLPLGPRKCLVVFDYFLEAPFKVISSCLAWWLCNKFFLPVCKFPINNSVNETSRCLCKNSEKPELLCCDFQFNWVFTILSSPLISLPEWQLFYTKKFGRQWKSAGIANKSSPFPSSSFVLCLNQLLLLPFTTLV